MKWLELRRSRFLFFCPRTDRFKRTRWSTIFFWAESQKSWYTASIKALNKTVTFCGICRCPFGHLSQCLAIKEYYFTFIAQPHNDLSSSCLLLDLHLSPVAHLWTPKTFTLDSSWASTLLQFISTSTRTVNETQNILDSSKMFCPQTKQEGLFLLF